MRVHPALWLQDVDTLPAAGQTVSPLKVKRATRGQGPSWLMATTYLTSTQGGAGRRAATGSQRFEMAQQQQELTREQQLADMEGTFTAAQQPPRHPTKPGVTAVSSVPILPDFGTWQDKYVTVNFEEGDPVQDSKTLAQVGSQPSSYTSVRVSPASGLVSCCTLDKHALSHFLRLFYGFVFTSVERQAAGQAAPACSIGEFGSRPFSLIRLVCVQLFRTVVLGVAAELVVPGVHSQVKDPELRAQLVSRCMIKSYQPQSGSEPAMGLLVPRAAAAAAAQGRPMADACAVDELQGDYNWDCEYSFDLVVRGIW